MVYCAQDWKDLWKPELTGKIAMVDSSREVVGAVLKSLGASYNTQDFDKDVKGGRAAVKQQFLALQKQVFLFKDAFDTIVCCSSSSCVD